MQSYRNLFWPYDVLPCNLKDAPDIIRFTCRVGADHSQSSKQKSTPISSKCWYFSEQVGRFEPSSNTCLPRQTRSTLTGQVWGVEPAANAR